MKMIYSFKLVVMILILSLLSGCVTTALYGEQFESTDKADTYTLKIAYGGGPLLPGLMPQETVEPETRKILDREAAKFIAENDSYTTYEIIEIEKKNILTYVIYTVKFE